MSIIVRFKNENKYLGAVLRALAAQDFPAFEVIGVDNCSTDGSTRIAREYCSRVLSIDDYQPGKALNAAVRATSAPFVAVVSAHAIPANDQWLGKLYGHMNESQLAGVYGAQLYPVNSEFLDKRDLDIFSSLSPRVETCDSDFWNANSMFPRAVWEEEPFDETVFELEDHYWTKQLLPRGYKVHFEPGALVYHYSHIDRNDREFLPPSTLGDRARIDKALRELDDSTAGWATVMRAGLTIASLTRSPHARKAVSSLGRLLRSHPDFDVRWRMAGALGKIEDPGSVRFLVEALEDDSFYVRDEAAWSLARLGGLAAAALVERLGELDHPSLPFAALALGRSGVPLANRLAVEVVRRECASGIRSRQRNAVYCAGEIHEAVGAANLIAPIEALLDESDAWMTSVCCWALGQLGARFSARIPRQRLLDLSRKDDSMVVRQEAVVALGKLALVGASEMPRAVLTEALSDSESRVRFVAAQSLRRLAEAGLPVELGPLPRDDPGDFGVSFELTQLHSLLDPARVESDREGSAKYQ